MQAIETEYRGPTNTRGSRIIARAQAGRISVPYDHALSVQENHDRAASELARQRGWAGVWVGGGSPAAGATAYFRGPELAQLMGHHGAGAHTHSHDGSSHDEANMPGLQGENASAEESAELAVLFRNYETLTREVTNLPDGIRTVTRSSDPEVMANLVSHVTGMIDRVGRKDDPMILIQSPTLDIFFARGEGITSEVTVTEEGIVVVQTSTDPEIVAALHTHAAEVSDMARRGMQAVHDAMAARGE
jgi:hypothetical protein